MALYDLSKVIVVEFNILRIKFGDKIGMKRLARHDLNESTYQTATDI